VAEVAAGGTAGAGGECALFFSAVLVTLAGMRKHFFGDAAGGLSALFASVLTCVLAGAFTGVSGAAPLDPKGIPASARGVVHLDLDAAGAGALLADAAGVPGADAAALPAALGIPASAVRGVTAGFIPTGESNALVALVRGDFTAEQVRARARAAKARESTLGGALFFDAPALLAGTGTTGGTADTGLADEGSVFHARDGVLIVAQKAGGFAADVVAAFDGRAPSFATPPALATFVSGAAPAAGKNRPPAVVAVFGDAVFPGRGGIGAATPAALLVAVSADGARLRARAVGSYADARSAERARDVLATMLGFLQLSAANAANAAGGAKPDPEKVARAARQNQLLNRLKMDVRGETLNLALECPAAEFSAWLRDLRAAKTSPPAPAALPAR
jgi:hypothetical protein